MQKNKSPSDNDQKKAAAKKGVAKARLAQLISLVVSTARVKGWDAYVEAEDKKTYRYATIYVSRFSSSHTITGTFEVLCDERIKITHHSTSFYNWGLADLYDAISNEFFKLPWVSKKTDEPPAISDLTIIERVLRRFHRMARQLKHRHDNRVGLEIKDEYDVQDVLHAILRGLFDDVRAEEYTPSYAGGSSRIDFLLKAEKIAIEVKIASAALRDKQIGEQLLIDIGRYQSHPDCRRLICFVYDPSGHLKNPSGLESDLSKTVEKLEIKVIVVSV